MLNLPVSKLLFRKLNIIIPVSILIIIFILRAVDHLNKISVTVDEPAHIGAGYGYINHGSYRINVEHPPLAKLLSGISLTLFFKPNVPIELESEYKRSRNQEHIIDQWEIGGKLLLANKEKLDKFLFVARWPLIVISIVLGIIIFLWSRDLYGNAGGFISLFIYTMCPNFLGHTGLVTYDVILSTFFTATLYFLYKYVQSREQKYIFFFSISLSLALISKFTAILLIPFTIIILLYHLLFLKDKSLFTHIPLQNIIIVFIIPLIVILISYQVIYAIRYLKALNGFFIGSVAGARNYLNGTVSSGSFTTYFLWAIIYKTPLALLILLLSSLFVKKIALCDEFVHLLLPALLLLLISSKSNKQLGIRYILPVLPFLYIFIGRVAILRFKSKIKCLIIIVLLLWLAVDSLKSHPHYISYFNDLAGGPENGHKHLIDSNIDWGQDLKELKKFLNENNNPELILTLFALYSDTPLLYDITSQPLLSTVLPTKPHINSNNPGKEYWAISVNHLYGLNFGDLLGWMRNVKPIAKAGYSIFIYDITDDISIRQKISALYRKKIYYLTPYGKCFLSVPGAYEREQKVIEKISRNKHP